MCAGWQLSIISGTAFKGNQRRAALTTDLCAAQAGGWSQQRWHAHWRMQVVVPARGWQSSVGELPGGSSGGAPGSGCGRGGASFPVIQSSQSFTWQQASAHL